MGQCSACTIDGDCSDGCGVVCSDDCGDCTFWCEPTKMGASDVTTHPFIRIAKRTADGRMRISVASEADPNFAHPDFPENTKFRLCFHDLPRKSLARLLNSMSIRGVRAAERSEERLSGSGTGTIAELAAKHLLLLE